MKFFYLREMELIHRPSLSPTADCTCTHNDVLTVAVTSLSNMEKYLEIDTPGIDNFVSLSSTLFSEEASHSVFTPNYLEKMIIYSLHHLGI